MAEATAAGALVVVLAAAVLAVVLGAPVVVGHKDLSHLQRGTLLQTHMSRLVQ